MNSRHLVRLRFLCFDLSSLPFCIYSIKKKKREYYSFPLPPSHSLITLQTKEKLFNFYFFWILTPARETNSIPTLPPSLLIKGKEMKSFRKLRGFASLHKQVVHKNPRDLPSFSQSHELAKASQVLFTPLPPSFLLCLDFAATKHDCCFFLLK